MAESAGIDIVFKVQDGNLVAILNGQVVSFGKLKDAIDATTASTGAMAEQNKNLEQSQQTVTESSGRLNRSLAGQLTALSRLQGGVAGLLPELASWTYLVRRLAIAMRGVLSMNPEWLIIAGAITAVAYAFKGAKEEADQLYASMKKVTDLRNALQQNQMGIEADEPLMRLQIERSVRGKSSEELEQMLKEAQEDLLALGDAMSNRVANAYEASQLYQQFQNANKIANFSAIRSPSQLLRYGVGGLGLLTAWSRSKDDVLIQQLLDAGFSMSDIEGASIFGARGIFGSGFWSGAQKLWDDRGERLKSNAENTSKDAEEAMKNRQLQEKREELLRKVVDAISEEVRAQEEIVRLEKERVEKMKAMEQASKYEEEGLRVANNFRETLQNRRHFESITAMGAQGVPLAQDWLNDLQSNNITTELQIYSLRNRLGHLNQKNDSLSAEEVAKNAEQSKELSEQIRGLTQEWSKNDALIAQLRRWIESADNLNQSMQEFDSSWGGQNEIESHGGRITNYDPYGGLSYNLNTADMERRQLEAQQSIQRSTNEMATVGVTVKL